MFVLPRTIVKRFTTNLKEVNVISTDRYVVFQGKGRQLKIRMPFKEAIDSIATKCEHKVQCDIYCMPDGAEMRPITHEFARKLDAFSALSDIKCVNYGPNYGYSIIRGGLLHVVPKQEGGEVATFPEAFTIMLPLLDQLSIGSNGENAVANFNGGQLIVRMPICNPPFELAIRHGPIATIDGEVECKMLAWHIHRFRVRIRQGTVPAMVLRKGWMLGDRNIYAKRECPYNGPEIHVEADKFENLLNVSRLVYVEDTRIVFYLTNGDIVAMSRLTSTWPEDLGLYKNV